MIRGPPSLAGELECDIPLVISNHPDLEHIARTFDIQFRHLPLNKVGSPGGAECQGKHWRRVPLVAPNASCDFPPWVARKEATETVVAALFRQWLRCQEAGHASASLQTCSCRFLRAFDHPPAGAGRHGATPCAVTSQSHRRPLLASTPPCRSRAARQHRRPQSRRR